MIRATVLALVFFVCLETQSQEKNTKGISFLSKEDAAKAIVDDTAEPYFSTLQPMEMSAKTGAPITGKTLKEQRTECQRRYADGTLDFSADEKEAITTVVTTLQPVLKKEFPLFAKVPWSFLKIKDTIEGGLPHTRGKHVVLSERYCKQVMQIKGQPKVSFLRIRFLELMVHEQTHVFQRKYPKAFDTLYTTIWKFKKASKITTNDYLKKYHLSNPDAVACQWVWPLTENGQTTTFWPLVIFSEGDGLKRMPADFQMVGIEVVQKDGAYVVQEGAQGAPKITALMTFGAYRKILPFSSNIYHPDEMSADTFAKLIVVDNFLPPIPDARQKAAIDEIFAPYRTWFKKNLAEKK